MSNTWGFLTLRSPSLSRAQYPCSYCVSHIWCHMSRDTFPLTMFGHNCICDDNEPPVFSQSKRGVTSICRLALTPEVHCLASQFSKAGPDRNQVTKMAAMTPVRTLLERMLGESLHFFFLQKQRWPSPGLDSLMHTRLMFICIFRLEEQVRTKCSSSENKKVEYEFQLRFQSYSTANIRNAYLHVPVLMTV